ncbi:MAG: thioredoxin domain-containing protein [Spirochaetales bacterium]
MNNHRSPNRLIHSTSPYLLQHAHNPVDWYPWGEEAFHRAKAEDKPVFLSIGYAACHWCHVMEKESFEDVEIARLLNTHFVSIKVDREERPDLDAIYMEAVQAISGRGGWPMSVFLTPSGLPFYAGTYFPPEDRWQIPSFRRVLVSVAEAYTTRKKELFQFGEQLVQQLQVHLQEQNYRESGSVLRAEILSKAFTSLQSEYDPEWGGFGEAPKFPNPALLKFLLQYGTSISSLETVVTTLTSMARGGIFDQVGGGFHRYSVDRRWLVPHFEKMLYDNALLAHLYLEAFQATSNPLYRTVAEKTLDYIIREMQDPDGGFYSSQDADSPVGASYTNIEKAETEEGVFYLWDYEELQQALKDDFPVFEKLYGVQTKGNFEGKNILYVRSTPEQISTETGISLEELRSLEKRALKTLQTLRNRRPPPATDDKILTAWNGMTLKALCFASIVLNREDWLQAAERCAKFLLSNLKTNYGTLLRAWRKGTPTPVPAFLEDYAHLAEGLLSLYEATLEDSWLQEARSLVDTAIDRFWDEASNTFQDKEKGEKEEKAEELILPPRMWYDQPTPSGTSTIIEILLKLSHVVQKPEYEEIASKALVQKLSLIQQYPSMFGRYLTCLDWSLNPPIVITFTGDFHSEDRKTLHKTVFQLYLPKKVLMFFSPPTSSANYLPTIPPTAPPSSLAQTASLRQTATALICHKGTCFKPTSSPQELLSLLQQFH